MRRGDATADLEAFSRDISHEREAVHLQRATRDLLLLLAATCGPVDGARRDYLNEVVHASFAVAAAYAACRLEGVDWASTREVLGSHGIRMHGVLAVEALKAPALEQSLAPRPPERQ